MPTAVRAKTRTWCRSRTGKKSITYKNGMSIMATQKTKTAGAIRAGNGKYHFRVAKVKKVAAGTGYSTSHGGVIEGARMLFGYIHKPRGTGSRMHSHPNEQFNYVVKGTLKGSVNGKRVLAPA